MSFSNGLLTFIVLVILSTNIMSTPLDKADKDPYVATFYNDPEIAALIQVPDTLMKRRTIPKNENNYLLRFGRSNNRPGDLERFLQMDVQIPVFRFGRK
uniref:Uncharacterized protein n=1 Tax=Parastrongyloides trichosuri TaxID=131310 RepID=A0A0N4Z0W4_PARTI